MPNFVYTNLTFNEINDAAKERWKELCGRIRTGDDINHGHMWFGDLWVDGKEGSPTYEETEKYAWTLDNVGPKWTYFEDFDETGFQTQSAWYYPEEGIQWLLNDLSKYDPKMVTSVTYEDEMPNFVGVYVFEGNDIIDGFEDDNDDIMHRVTNQYPELNGKWDDDEGEWADEESEDLFREVIWEVIGDAQWNLIQEVQDYLKEEKN